MPIASNRLLYRTVHVLRHQPICN